MDGNSPFSRRNTGDINNTNFVTDRGSSYQSKSNGSRIFNNSNLFINQPHLNTQYKQNSNNIISSTTIKREERMTVNQNAQFIEDVETKKYRHTVGPHLKIIDTTQKKKSVFKEEEDQEATKNIPKCQFSQKKTLLSSVTLKGRKLQLQTRKETLLLPKPLRAIFEAVNHGNGERRSSSDISAATFVRSTTSTDISYE